MATNFKELNSSLENFIKKYDNAFEEYKKLFEGKKATDPLEDYKKIKNKSRRDNNCFF